MAETGELPQQIHQQLHLGCVACRGYIEITLKF